MSKFINGAEVRPEILDHRELGKRLEYFSFHEEASAQPFFKPNGLKLKENLIHRWRKEHEGAGYIEIESPQLLDRSLWECSGHWDLYKEHMFLSESGSKSLAIKPMNCPGAMLVFKEKKRSFKELPLRLCEMGKVHRDENSGSVHGLMRVKAFSVDDAHIFCEAEQLLNEVKGVINLIYKILEPFNFPKFEFELSVRGRSKMDKYLGAEEDWNFAESILAKALEEMSIPYKVVEGEAKFYGPAIELRIGDSFGRSWQCSSIQMDFNLSERFKISYLDKNDQKKVPFILHRCIYGSLERFMGILLEHYQGAFPVWLAPIQVQVISLNEDNYADSIFQELRDLGYRVELDLRDKSLSVKMKDFRKSKIPLAIIVGEKERKDRSISIKEREGKSHQFKDIDYLKYLLNSL